MIDGGRKVVRVRSRSVTPGTAANACAVASATDGSPTIVTTEALGSPPAAGTVTHASSSAGSASSPSSRRLTCCPGSEVSPSGALDCAGTWTCSDSG